MCTHIAQEKVLFFINFLKGKLPNVLNSSPQEVSDSQDDLKQSLQDARDPPPKLVSAKGYLDRWIREHRGPHLGSGQPLTALLGIPGARRAGQGGGCGSACGDGGSAPAGARGQTVYKEATELSHLSEGPPPHPRP